MALLAWWRRPSRARWCLVVAALAGLDQISKAFFADWIPLYGVVEVTPFFNLVHTLNEGAAFSFLADAGGWQRLFLIVVSVAVIVPVTLVSLAASTSPMERKLGALVVAGGLGNLVDRVQTGAVVDFLDFHVQGWHWPAFNLADVFIVCAAMVWVTLAWRPATRVRDHAPVSPVSGDRS